jgi:undecaprenyl-diphosphatase
MDWSIVHSLNGFLYHHDAIEDPLLDYVQAAEALFFLLLAVLCVFARHERFAPVRRAAVAAGLSAGLGLLVVKIITEFYDRARPFVAHPGAVHLFAKHAADASFPSDHATASMAIAVAFLLRRRFGLGALTLVFALILDFGRVAVGFHYPTDVLGGAAIGALAALVLWAPLLRRRIDVLSDFIGGLWDRTLDAVLERIRPVASRAHAELPRRERRKRSTQHGSAWMRGLLLVALPPGATGFWSGARRAESSSEVSAPGGDPTCPTTSGRRQQRSSPSQGLGHQP